MSQEPTKKKLTTLDEMFGNLNDTKKENKVNEIEINLLTPFKNHPFQLYTGSRYEDMVRSIKEFGILSPLIVRPINEQLYEILAGHNRWNAAKNAEIRKVPVIIMDGLSDEEAMLIVTETNLIQRSFTDLSHSERAFVLAQHYEALKSQGKRMDIINEVKMLLNADEISDEATSGPVGQKLDSREIAGLSYNLSSRSVARYLRINVLDKGIKDKIDIEQISIRAGVELSYLSSDNQLFLVDILNNNNYKIDMKIATELKVLEKRGKLNQRTIENVLSGNYKKPKKASTVLSGIKIKPLVMKKYFNEKQSVKEVEDIIDKALEFYYQNNKV